MATDDFQRFFNGTEGEAKVYHVEKQETGRVIFAHTETKLEPFVFERSECHRRFGDSLKLYKVPAPAEGLSGLRRVVFDDINEGDFIVAIDGDDDRLSWLQLWYVTRIDDREKFWVAVNNFVGFGSHSEILYETFTGMLGK